MNDNYPCLNNRFRNVTHLKEPALMKRAYGRKRHGKIIVFRADEPNEIMDQINLIRNQISCEKLDHFVMFKTLLESTLMKKRHLSLRCHH